MRPHRPPAGIGLRLPIMAAAGLSLLIGLGAFTLYILIMGPVQWIRTHWTP